MEINTREDIWEALDYIREKYNIPNKDIAFKCVQKAMSLGYKKLEFDARNQYLSQLVFCHLFDEAIAQYPWLLNYKKNNELNPDSIYSVLWKFKWVIDKLPDYHSIPLSKIYSMVTQFEEEYTAAGNTEKVIEYYKFLIYLPMGKIEKAEEHLKKYKKVIQKGEFEDCYACQLNSQIDLYFVKKDYQKVIENSKDLVNKKYSCGEVPNVTYPKLTFAHLMLGQLKQAEEYFQLSLKSLKLDIPQEKLYFVLFYLGKIKGFVQGKKIIDKQMHFIFASKSDLLRYKFYSACYIFFKYAEQEGIKTFKIKSNEQLNFVKPIKDDEYNISVIRQWFYDQSLLHATLLDKRNENSYYQDYLKYLDDTFKN